MIVLVLRCILFSSHYIDVLDSLITLDIETSGAPSMVRGGHQQP